MFDRFNFESTGACPPIVMTVDQFNRFEREHGEYSCSLPTGTTPGKQWVRNRNAFNARDFRCPDFGWDRGTYVEIPVHGRIGIRWEPIVIAEALIIEGLFAAAGLV